MEIMNQNLENKVVYMTITYDVVPNHPFWGDIKILWLNLRQRGTREVTPSKGSPQFVLGTIGPPLWKEKVLGGIGHVNDGAVKAILAVDNKTTCDNTASYHSVAGPHDKGATNHISDISICHSTGISKHEMKKEQVWNLRAYYDFDKFKDMANENKSWDKVMGLILVFVRTKN